jgi:hypothetical protein
MLVPPLSPERASQRDEMNAGNTVYEIDPRTTVSAA